MSDLFTDSVYFGFVLCLLSYFAAVKLRKLSKLEVLNPILVAAAIIIVFLLVFNIPYGHFKQGVNYINYLLTPTTVCLALPLYRQVQVLKKYWFPILCGLMAGCAATMLSVIGLCYCFKLDLILLRSLLPKSITSAIALGVSQEIGGIAPVTVAAVIVTGFIGAVTANVVFKIFHIKDPVAQGLALGASAHGIGTTKAIELGEVQGAMSSMAIVVSGVITVIAAPIISGILG